MIYWEIEKTTDVYIKELILKEKNNDIFQARVEELAALQEVMDGNIMLSGNDIGEYLHKGFEI